MEMVRAIAAIISYSGLDSAIKLAETSETAIAVTFLVMNLEKWLKTILFYFFSGPARLIYGQFIEKQRPYGFLFSTIKR